MTGNVYSRQRRSARGFSLNELMITMAVILTIGAISVPQLVASRRAIRSASVTREIASQLRDARQMAISQRRAVTFQYDDSAKSINIINHGADAQGVGVSGVGVLTDSNYPNTAGSFVAYSRSLAAGGVPTSEIAYGLPSGLSSSLGTLGDRTTLSTLSGQNLNITFQPDGTVINSSGATRDFALFIYNTAKPSDTAAAISVLGGTGRVKAWRYSSSVDKFVE
jgi:prepilin-type N-terminal cleavage/methylation domain-containing protein